VSSLGLHTKNSILIARHEGFSFVYLISDTSSLRQYALKKILISSSSSNGGGGGEEAVKEVMKEVEAYRRFKHPNIIKILDVAVVQSDEEGGGGKVVYL
jgi:serine/threonine kinase 16